MKTDTPNRSSAKFHDAHIMEATESKKLNEEKRKSILSERKHPNRELRENQVSENVNNEMSNAKAVDRKCCKY